jgi:outer membrane protein assembly factor BamB
MPLWHTTISLDKGYYDFETPVFANNDIVAFISYEADASAKRSGYINVLDARTHTLRWRAQIGNVGPINVVGNTLYLFGQIDGNFGVFAFDIHSGKQLWHTETGTGLPYPQVVYLDGRLYVGEPDQFNCLNAQDGKSIWHVHLPTVALSAAAAAGVVYLGGLDGYVYGVDAATGKIRWQYQVNAPIIAQPLAVNGAVYIGDTSGYLWAFNGQNGGLYWKGFAGTDTHGTPTNAGSDAAQITTRPVINRNVVAILAGNILATFDLRTGQPRWKYTVKQSDSAFHLATGPVIFKDLFIVGSNENHVTALNP